MRINKLLLYGGASLFAAILLGGCGGGDSAPVAEVFPRAIQYKTLEGQFNGLISPGLGIYQTLSVNSCRPGLDWCLLSLTPLASKEQLQTFVVQSQGNEETKPEVLAAGSSIDFAKEQLWAFKLGVSNVAEAVLSIQETATTIEIRPVVCNNVVLTIYRPFLKDLFVVVPRDLPAKPVVFLDSGDVRYGPDCPFFELVRKN